jgi:hypothetical protein
MMALVMDSWWDVVRWTGEVGGVGDAQAGYSVRGEAPICMRSLLFQHSDVLHLVEVFAPSFASSPS